MTKPIILVIGPSGSGKTSLINSALSLLPSSLTILKSLTTRPTRGPEDENWYKFVDFDESRDLFEAGELAQFTFFGGNFYGTTRQDIEDILNTHKIPILAATEEGYAAFLKAGYDPQVIQIQPINHFVRPGRELADKNRKPLPDHIPRFTVTNNFADPNGFEEALDQFTTFLNNIINTHRI